MAEKDILAETLEQLSKTYGEGTILDLTKKSRVDVETVSTGLPSLDVILGGGVPKGRIIEVYGPEASGKTTMALHMLMKAQQAQPDKKVAFIDAENAFDPAYAEKLGIDLKGLFFNQPNSGEEAFDITEKLCQTGRVSVIVIDSVASLIPKAAGEKEIDGTANIGTTARLMSQNLPRLSKEAAKTGTTIILINQIRMKIGVMYGCFQGDTPVPMADGTGKLIKDIAVGDSVLSFDEQLGKVVPRKVLETHDNGKANKMDFITVNCALTGNRNGLGSFTLTKDHLILTDEGWRPAKELVKGSKLVTKMTRRVNSSLAEFLNGTLVGDSHIAIRSQNTGCLKMQDSTNEEYVAWKADKLAALGMSQSDKRWESEQSEELALIKNALGDRNPMYMLSRFSWLSMAVWIMDDGHFDSKDGHYRYTLSVKRLRGTKELDEVVSYLSDALGLICSARSDGSIAFSSSATRKIAANICTFVPESMQYKLPDEFKGKHKGFTLKNKIDEGTRTVEVTSVTKISERKARNLKKYDLTIEGTHNYLVGGIHNGVVAHNSPETTPGGMALKYFASVRMEVRGSKPEEREGKEGHVVRVKIVKNKIARPGRNTEVFLMYGDGFDAEGDMIETAVSLGIVEKSGAWYKYDGINAQGMKGLMAELRAQPEKKEAILKKLSEVKV